MTSKTFDIIEENIRFAMIDYITFIIEQRNHIIQMYGFNIPLKYDDDEGEWLIYELLFRCDDYESELFYGFESFCEDNGYFYKDDFDILNEYANDTNTNTHGDYAINNTTTILKKEVKKRDLYFILAVCVNKYYYTKMTACNDFINIWNELNCIVRNNILK